MPAKIEPTRFAQNLAGHISAQLKMPQTICRLPGNEFEPERKDERNYRAPAPLFCDADCVLTACPHFVFRFL